MWTSPTVIRLRFREGGAEQEKHKPQQSSVCTRSLSYPGTGKPPTKTANLVNTIYCLLFPLYVGMKVDRVERDSQRILSKKTKLPQLST